MAAAASTYSGKDTPHQSVAAAYTHVQVLLRGVCERCTENGVHAGESSLLLLLLLYRREIVNLRSSRAT